GGGVLPRGRPAEAAAARGRGHGRAAPMRPAPPGPRLFGDLDGVAAVHWLDRDDPRPQRDAFTDGACQRLGELVRAAVEHGVAPIVARHRLVTPWRAALVAPQPQGAVQRDLDRRTRVHDLAPAIEE